jgi:CRP-like cAMP-binding protein
MNFDQALGVAHSSAWLARQGQFFQTAVSNKLKLRTFKKGEPLFHLGDKAQELFCVTGGAVGGAIDHPLLGLVTIAVWRPGDWFGQSACLGMHGRLVSAHARDLSHVLSISREAVAEMVRGEPSFAFSFFDLIADKTETCHLREADLLIADARLRLYSRLLTLCGRRGCRKPGQPIQLPLSKEEMAMACSMSRQTVHRLLSELTKDGICRLGYREIAVTDPEALTRKFAEQAAALLPADR